MATATDYKAAVKTDGVWHMTEHNDIIINRSDDDVIWVTSIDDLEKELENRYQAPERMTRLHKRQVQAEDIAHDAWYKEYADRRDELMDQWDENKEDEDDFLERHGIPPEPQCGGWCDGFVVTDEPYFTKFNGNRDHIIALLKQDGSVLIEYGWQQQHSLQEYRRNPDNAWFRLRTESHGSQTFIRVLLGNRPKSKKKSRVLIPDLMSVYSYLKDRASGYNGHVHDISRIIGFPLHNGHHEPIIHKLLIVRMIVTYYNMIHGKNAHRGTPEWQAMIKKWRASRKESWDYFKQYAEHFENRDLQPIHEWLEEESRRKLPKIKDQALPKTEQYLELAKKYG